MELTMNHANLGLGNMNVDDNGKEWNLLPQFGFQKFVSETAECIFDAIHRSFDYKGKSTTRELVTFLVFAVILQGALIPTETYTTVHANISMLVAAILTDLVACIIPGVALIVRWMK